MAFLLCIYIYCILHQHFNLVYLPYIIARLSCPKPNVVVLCSLSNSSCLALSFAGKG